MFMIDKCQGDTSDWCPGIRPADCYFYYNDCCETCNSIRVEHEGEASKRLSWHGSECPHKLLDTCRVLI